MSRKPLQVPYQSVHVVVGGIVLLLISFALQQLSTLTALMLAEPITFTHPGPGLWSASLSQLPPGVYALEAGRPRGLCTARIGSLTVASTVSLSGGLRSAMMLGGEFQRTVGSPDALAISCLPEAGFRPSLPHQPIVASHNAAILVKALRAFTELLLGPLSSVLLLIFITVLCIRRKFIPQDAAADNSELALLAPRLFAFAVVSLAYALSLAHISRLFIPGFEASLGHALLKSAHQSAYIFVCTLFLRRYYLPYGLMLAHALIMILIAFQDRSSFESWYDYTYTLFPLTSGLVAVGLFKGEAKRESQIILRYLAVAVFGGQFIDNIVIWTNVGVYSGPTFLSLMALMCVWLALREVGRTERIERVVADIGAVIVAPQSVPDLVRALSRRAFESLYFTRLSAYIDGFAIGFHDRPCEILLRLVEVGYQKTTEPDSLISFSDGRGQKMQQALNADGPILGCGEVDHAYFINLGVGHHACFNFSDDKPRPPYMAYESLEVLRRLTPLFATLASRFVEFGFRNGVALERLRSIHGDGVKTLHAGAIFADINDFTLLTHRFGDVFSAFVASIYLPALCKRIRPWAVREFSRGDEVYLVTVADLIEDTSSVATATLQAVEGIQDFAANDGAMLCLQNGFPPLSLTIGANVGSAAVICDAFSVRTSGDMVNEASRLKDAAPKGSALLHQQLIALLAQGNLRLSGEDVTILVKKTLVQAKILTYVKRPTPMGVA